MKKTYGRSFIEVIWLVFLSGSFVAHNWRIFNPAGSRIETWSDAMFLFLWVSDTALLGFALAFFLRKFLLEMKVWRSDPSFPQVSRAGVMVHAEDVVVHNKMYRLVIRHVTDPERPARRGFMFTLHRDLPGS